VRFDRASTAGGSGSWTAAVRANKRTSRVQRDVLGIFGPVRHAQVAPAAPPACTHGSEASSGDEHGDAPRSTVSAATRWQQARLVAQQELLVSRWHKDVDRVWKRLWLGFRTNHTLMAGLCYRGAGGHTRAQTVMILLNSLALELVLLCMFYSMPDSGPIVVNPVTIVVSGMLVACIGIPACLTFVWLFDPILFVRLVLLVVRMLCCIPCASRCLRKLGCCHPSAVHLTAATTANKQQRNPPSESARGCAWPVTDRSHPLDEGPTAIEAADGGGSPTPIVGVRIPDCSTATSAADALVTRTTVVVLGPTSKTMRRTTTTTTTTTMLELVDLADPYPSPSPPPSPPSADVLSTAELRTHPLAPPEATASAQSNTGSSTPTTRRPVLLVRQLTSGVAAAPRHGLSMLRRAVSNLNASAAPPREFSHASLDEHMLSLCLTHQVAMRNWRAVAKIAFGWLSNLLAFFGMLLTFLLYACELFSSSDASSVVGATLLFSWAVSVLQRFLVNEPMLIVCAKGAPICFASDFCSNLCGETVVNLLDLGVQSIMACISSIKT